MISCDKHNLLAALLRQDDITCALPSPEGASTAASCKQIIETCVYRGGSLVVFWIRIVKFVFHVRSTRIKTQNLNEHAARIVVHRKLTFP